MQQLRDRWCWTLDALKKIGSPRPPPLASPPPPLPPSTPAPAASTTAVARTHAHTHTCTHARKHVCRGPRVLLHSSAPSCVHRRGGGEDHHAPHVQALRRRRGPGRHARAACLAACRRGRGEQGEGEARGAGLRSRRGAGEAVRFECRSLVVVSLPRMLPPVPHTQIEAKNSLENYCFNVRNTSPPFHITSSCPPRRRPPRRRSCAARRGPRAPS